VSRVARDWAWALSVTPTQKLVITALAERADSEGRCFPSLTHLTGMTGLARSTVAAALDELEAAHWIVRVRGGGRKSTRYQLLLRESGAVAMSPGVGRTSATDTSGHSPGETTGDRTGQPPQARAVQEMDPCSPTGGPVQEEVVHPTDPSSPGGGYQGSGGRTPAVRDTAPCGPTDGQVQEAVVRPTDPSSPGGEHQQSGGRTGAVREANPNRQYNRHITVSESAADVVDTHGQDRKAKHPPKATSIPHDWRPSERVFDWAAKQGMTPTWVEAQIDEFLVYWTDTGEARKSWDATFINRLQALQAKQPKDHLHEPEPRLADKDYLTGATPLDEIPWLNPTAVR
jgi:hypothetical protein